MSPSRVRSAAAVAVLAAALAGCGLYSPLPAPLTPDEVRAIYEEERELYWEVIGQGEPLPVIETTETLPPGEEGWLIIADCVADRELEGVVISNGSIHLGPGADALEMERAMFLCNATHPPDFADREQFGYLSPAEREYLWDYYRNYLVPCLALNGHDAAGMPARETFLGSPYLTWSPYYTVSVGTSVERWEYLDSRCAPPPIGPTYRPIRGS